MNWIHLELRGMLHRLDFFLSFLSRLSAGDVQGIVFDYEDRLPLDCLPGVHRPGYSAREWETIWDHCRALGLRVMPLVQVQGHLEWALKYPQYAHLREAGFWSEICPSQPEARDFIYRIVDEVIDRHPFSEYIHLGADETWHLASCPACRDKAADSEYGRTGVYLSHVAGICRHVADRGRRPLVWADMFRGAGPGAARELPPETILVDWYYHGRGPWETTATLRESGREVWGASAARCAFNQKYTLAPIGSRIENILAWEKWREQGMVSAVIHTAWSRASSLREIYGPWEGWWPAFLAAISPGGKPKDQLARLVPEVDRAMSAPERERSLETVRLLEKNLAGMEEINRSCLEWWIIALRHRDIMLDSMNALFKDSMMGAVGRSVGLEPATVRSLRKERRDIRKRVLAWREEADEWLARHGYDDRQEYLETRLDGITRCLSFRPAARTDDSYRRED